MSGVKADPECQNCGGSGIEPGSGENYGMPYGIDPSTYEPCACVLEQMAGKDARIRRVTERNRAVPDRLAESGQGEREVHGNDL